MTYAPMWSWSCDTFAVRPTDGSPDLTIFGKNSDRPARECQPLRHVRARSGAGVLRLAYLQIEDQSETIAHLGSSPYWCWGHEMGVNAAGVAIGNEALFTRELAHTVSRVQSGETIQPGILGMEMVRIALERAKERGVDVTVTFFKSEDVASQAVVGGEADIGVGTPYALIQKVKAPIRLFYQMSALRFFPIVNTEF